MSYRVVIPTAGIGSRLGDLTEYINKSLVSISCRPTLSHLIEQFPADCEFVIALGHKGNLIREFVEIAYSHRRFYFADVDPYVGPGSGLGHSLLCCEKYLRLPFIFVSCDTLVKETIPPPEHDWIGYAETTDTYSYRTISVNQNIATGIFEKGSKNVEHTHAYIGLSGINDYDYFWSQLREGDHTAIDQGEAYGLRSLLEKKRLNAHPFTWFDTGTPSNLKHTRNAYSQRNEPNILEKKNEAIWFVNNLVIKFSNDKDFIANRVKRSVKLSEFTPKIISSSDHMYAYKKVHGEVVSKVITLPLFKKLLVACSKFWMPAELTTHQKSHFEHKCKAFYYDKTLQRVNLFYQNFGKEDALESINDEPMPLLSSLLERIDWEKITTGLPGRFHGDFHFENILLDLDSNSFIFLDWRQDFGGDLDVGDIYYDLAKLLHGLIVSHELIAKDYFAVEWNSNGIRFDLHRRQILVECEKYLEIWCKTNNYDFSKVRVLTALIYLNIAALHHYPYSLMLYALGKQMLYYQLGSQPAQIKDPAI